MRSRQPASRDRTHVDASGRALGDNPPGNLRPVPKEGRGSRVAPLVGEQAPDAGCVTNPRDARRKATASRRRSGSVRERQRRAGGDAC